MGKHVDDLQTGVSISGTSISGTLKFVTGYTGFSGDVSEQSGNYLALHFNVPGVTGETISVELVGGSDEPIVLDSDGLVVLRITNKNTQYIKVVAGEAGYVSIDRAYDLSSLTLNTA